MNEVGQLPSPAIGISLSIEVAKGRSLVFQTHLEQSQPLAFINEQLDKLNAAADRQQAIYELEGLEFQLRHDERIYEQAATDYLAIEQRQQNDWDARGRRGEFKLTPKEEQERANARSLVERMKAQIGAVKDKIAETKAKTKIGEKVAA